MSDSFLHFAGVLASYFLRVAAAYALCWLLTRLSPSPRRRFLLWLAFLLGAAGYWAFILVPLPLHASLTAAVQTLPVHASRAAHNLIIPAAWEPVLAFLGPLFAAAYALGVLLFSGRVLWQHLSLRRALRHAAAPSRDLAALFEQMCRGFGVRRCDLLILPQLSSPAAAGWLHPRILLPEVCEQFDDSSPITDVLYHELMHVVRRDYLWSALSDVVRCFLFFHPAVWQARQHMRVQRELACDVAVVSGRPEHRADYAQSLTRFARLRMLQPGRSLGIDFAASASILGMRVRAVLSHRPQRSWWQRGLRSALSLALLVSFALTWPMFGIVAEFAEAPQFVAEVAPPLRAAVMAPRKRRLHLPATRHTAVPEALYQPTQALLLPPLMSQPEAAANASDISSSRIDTTSDSAQPEPGSVADNGDPTWTETLPLPRTGTSAASVVQRVARGLAQIGREEIGREGHDHGGR
jgi:beta-lactamase regulating signal transducer with metallopeptidase domain